jgi:hypothetical protein
MPYHDAFVPLNPYAFAPQAPAGRKTVPLAGQDPVPNSGSTQSNVFYINLVYLKKLLYICLV